MKRKFIFVVLLLQSAINLFAQKFLSPVKPSLIGLHYTLVDYISPTLIKNTSLQDVLKKGNIFNPAKQSSAFTISYWKGFSKYIDFSGKVNGISSNYARQNDSNGSPSKKEFGAEIEGNVTIHPLSDAHFFIPFITVGMGGGYYANKVGGYIPLGLDLQLNFKNSLYLFLENQFRLSLSTTIFPDNLLHSIGVAVNISQKKKSVPKQLRLAVASDRDSDGVIDNLDACPGVAGPAALNGCPDRDGDEIADRIDSCVDIAGVAKYQGCPVPDSDGDGIIDENDKCLYVAGVARYQGCPVPDTDHDSLNDEEDKCPDQAGPVYNFGCPEIKKDIIEEINLAAKHIFFSTGSDKLLPESYSSLNNVANILAVNTSYKISVEGHTDNSGATAKNQILAENRAASVKAYLVSKGIDERRIMSAGFGADKPIADNKTVRGKAENRRVELKLKNY